MRNKKLSKNELNGKNYPIPENLDDRKAIDDFLDLNKGKEVVVVQGLGFVGAVMSLVCSNALHKEYAVIGIDLPTPESFWKICSINEGVFPIKSSDTKVEEYFQNATKKKNFHATYDAYAYSKADVVIVDINLDVDKQNNHVRTNQVVDYSVDLSGFESAMKLIGASCKEDILVLIETTVPPGTTKLAYEILKFALKERGLDSDMLKVGHSYERVMPGPNYIDSIQNFYRVYSGINEYSANHVENFLKTIIKVDEYPLTRLINTNATEISKVLENSFRAMNIAFIVEWSRYAEEAGVNLYEIIEAIRMRPTHKNIMLPGIGVGGYCLTKDPLLASWSKQHLIGGDLPLSMSEEAVTINDKMPLFAFNFLKKHIDKNSSKKIYLLGVSYAPDIGDTRYSPVELFANLLNEDGHKLYFSDPFVNFWEELQVTVSNDFKNLSDPVDIIVITTAHSIYKNNKNLISSILALKKVLIFDTVGILNDDEIKLLSKKHSIKILGRGDLEENK